MCVHVHTLWCILEHAHTHTFGVFLVQFGFHIRFIEFGACIHDTIKLGPRSQIIHDLIVFSYFSQLTRSHIVAATRGILIRLDPYKILEIGE